MKNTVKFIGIAVFVTVIGLLLAACGDGGGGTGGGQGADGLPPAGNGSISFPLTSTEVYNLDGSPFTGNMNFTKALYYDNNGVALIEELTNRFSGPSNNISVTNGSLSLTMGAPLAQYLSDVSSGFPASYTITRGLRVSGARTFISSDGNYCLVWINLSDYSPYPAVEFVYANMAGVVSGRHVDIGGFSGITDMVYINHVALRQGWNTLTTTPSYSYNPLTYIFTTVSGRPGNGYEWVIVPISDMWW